MTQLLDSRTISAAIRSPSMLASLLGVIKEVEYKSDYTTRNTAILHAVVVAQLIGIPAGIILDPNEPDWPVAMIELPQGQVSWHLEKHGWAWDGHTTEQKWERVDAYIARQRSEDTPMLHNAADYMAALKHLTPTPDQPMLDPRLGAIRKVAEDAAHDAGLRVVRRDETIVEFMVPEVKDDGSAD